MKDKEQAIQKSNKERQYLVLSTVPRILPEPQHLIFIVTQRIGASQTAQWQRTHLPMQEMRETSVRSLGQEDPLGKAMATNSSIVAWRIPWTEEPSGLHTVYGVEKSQTLLNNQRIVGMILSAFSISKPRHREVQGHMGIEKQSRNLGPDLPDSISTFILAMSLERV